MVQQLPKDVPVQLLIIPERGKTLDRRNYDTRIFPRLVQLAIMGHHDHISDCALCEREQIPRRLCCICWLTR
ncbi:hypothetical protein RM96_17680 [Cupriavidus sp. IDO]|nr:hypothetical protein RM96_17680 [Cupriavidus sp. IDO]